MKRNRFKVEYIWLDGNNPSQLRSKTKIIDSEKDSLKLNEIPQWSFDGSSTNQAEGKNSDCILKPVYIIEDIQRNGFSYIVLCEVYESDGVNPHPSNHRAKLREIDGKYHDLEMLFGFEQEYTLINLENGKPIGFPDNYQHYPKPQGSYYCSVGADNSRGRALVEEHLDTCLDSGLMVSGINAEVMIGQWEYQIGPLSALEVSDQIILSRYLLHRTAEMYNVGVSLHPKPISGPWNGSGCHINISTKNMREEKGIKEILTVVKEFGKNHKKFIDSYGEYNNLRLTGEYETSPINEYSWDYSNRGCSVRIPVSSQLNGKGYFEDRRPSSNVDPYKGTTIIMESIGEILS